MCMGVSRALSEGKVKFGSVGRRSGGPSERRCRLQSWKNCCVGHHACLSCRRGSHAGCVQQLQIDFKGGAASSDALTEADRDLDASQIFALRILARGLYQVSTAEFRRMVALSGETLPPELLDSEYVLRLLKHKPDGAACHSTMQSSSA